jgi:hypothetical protein
MGISALYTKYFQKSKIFMYPLLDIKRGCSVTPIQTYFEWEGHYTAEDMKLITVYPIRDDQEYMNFMKHILLKHNRVSAIHKIDATQQIIIFDFSDLKDDWFKLIDGQYSKLTMSLKRKIKDHFDKKSSSYVYIDSYLFPERYFEMYSDLLGVNQNLLKEVGELCSKPDLEKEKLIQDIEELHNTKILD